MIEPIVFFFFQRKQEREKNKWSSEQWVSFILYYVIVWCNFDYRNGDECVPSDDRLSFVIVFFFCWVFRVFFFIEIFAFFLLLRESVLIFAFKKKPSVEKDLIADLSLSLITHKIVDLFVANFVMCCNFPIKIVIFFSPRRLVDQWSMVGHKNYIQSCSHKVHLSEESNVESHIYGQLS